MEGLGIPNLPQIEIVAQRIGGMTTGAYDPATHKILVLGGSRALADVLRTLAHELTHYRQRLQNKIKSTKRDWEIEGEADAEAGKMVYTYAHTVPENMAIYDL
jgi:Zn-dependent peptidase ImmA (M78 family)